jgi:hypothetical protein
MERKPIKSKFINKIYYVNDKYYQKYVSSYILVTRIERHETSRDNSYLNIYYIGIRGDKKVMDEEGIKPLNSLSKEDKKAFFKKVSKTWKVEKK